MPHAPDRHPEDLGELTDERAGSGEAQCRGEHAKVICVPKHAQEAQSQVLRVRRHDNADLRQRGHGARTISSP